MQGSKEAQFIEGPSKEIIKDWNYKQLTKYGMWSRILLHSFYAALNDGQLPGFLTSSELDRFLREGGVGSLGHSIPSGEPGSEFPTIGHSIIETLHGLLHGIGSDLGTIDGPGGVDPAANPDEDKVRIATGPGGNIHTMITHPDRSTEEFVFYADGSTLTQNASPEGKLDWVRITPNAAGGGCTIETGSWVPGNSPHSNIQHYGRDGNPLSPGEGGGGDTNTGGNPLSSIQIIGPQSSQSELEAMKHPVRDSEKLDSNTGESGFEFSKEDEERLGRIVPALEVLDPNSGVDPLSKLSIDPNQLHTRSEEDTVVDPNTGRKPFPGGDKSKA